MSRKSTLLFMGFIVAYLDVHERLLSCFIERVTAVQCSCFGRHLPRRVGSCNYCMMMLHQTGVAGCKIQSCTGTVVIGDNKGTEVEDGYFTFNNQDENHFCFFFSSYFGAFFSTCCSHHLWRRSFSNCFVVWTPDVFSSSSMNSSHSQHFVLTPTSCEKRTLYGRQTAIVMASHFCYFLTH